MNATIPAGAITALVGPSGSGKSTLSRLIARFWDVNKGQVEIGGIDVKELDPEHLMEYMSFVFQDVVLFNDTVYNNIKIGNMNATEEQVLAAAKAARCDEFIEKCQMVIRLFWEKTGVPYPAGNGSACPLHELC